MQRNKAGVVSALCTIANGNDAKMYFEMKTPVIWVVIPMRSDKPHVRVLSPDGRRHEYEVSGDDADD